MNIKNMHHKHFIYNLHINFKSFLTNYLFNIAASKFEKNILSEDCGAYLIRNQFTIISLD